ncbi:Rhodanese-like protein [Linderina pennispora]|uniref:Rhodanese-like protein n=1 Tax=Linderina pennispora TaxID=61395 RepID=A0A1Y1WLK4_9FUNG|nr:Rhodanese-like protein [Linderina pennispora]ORX74449.1 Rhodanese-like protein [Linderina pennispora]
MPVQSITASEFSDIVSVDSIGKYVVIDVRTPEEFAEGNVESSHNLPVAELADALAKSEDEFKDTYGFNLPAPNSTTMLVVYCRSGNRVRRAEGILAQAGYIDNLLAYYPGWLEYSTIVAS